MRVPEEARRVLPEEVDVLKPVGIPEASALPAYKGGREGSAVKDRAGVAARKRRARLFVKLLTLGIAFGIVVPCGCERFGQIRVRGNGAAHECRPMP